MWWADKATVARFRLVSSSRERARLAHSRGCLRRSNLYETFPYIEGGDHLARVHHRALFLPDPNARDIRPVVSYRRYRFDFVIFIYTPLNHSPREARGKPIQSHWISHGFRTFSCLCDVLGNAFRFSSTRGQFEPPVLPYAFVSLAYAVEHSFSTRASRSDRALFHAQHGPI